MLFRWIIFALSLAYAPAVTRLASDESYVAAVLEYNPINTAGLEVLELNAINMEKYMEYAKKMEAEIMVLPEYGLNGLNNDNMTCLIPAPADKIAPCDSSETCQAIRTLSCAARTLQMYVVFNVREHTSCEDVSCDGHNIHDLTYNTNVVLDRNGTIIARHRKYHLFNDKTDRPPKPEITYFDTDFGVRFGLITCFEIFFEEPSRTLVEDKGLNNIIINTAWSSQLPTELANQIIFGWAYRRNVNVLSAGLNSLTFGASGSGIFRGRAGMAEYFTSDVDKTRLLVNKVYKEAPGPNTPHKELPTGGKVPDQGLTIRQGMMHKGTAEIIHEEKFAKQLCHRKLCCDFNVSYVNNNDGLFYMAYVFDGVIDFHGEGTGGSQDCIITVCTDSNKKTSCGVRALSEKKFQILRISGDFRSHRTLQMPSTMRQGEYLDALQPSYFDHTVKCNETLCHNEMSLTRPVSQLITFGIRGRDYAKDGQPADELMKDSAAKTQLSLIMGIIIISFSPMCSLLSSIT